jgi:hypothetical protein
MIRKSLFAMAASLMTLSAFSATLGIIGSQHAAQVQVV